MYFSSEIIVWYNRHKRDLPWRNTKDPYKIWLSEIILQQTRVEQGLPYYLKFIKAFPTVKHLAKAPEDKVMKLWQGLGYYSRARNLHATAKAIVKIYKGKFPSDYASIRNLKGIGDYTAAAISSFAFDQRYPVEDGNVYRLLSRHYGIATPVNTSHAKQEFYALAKSLIEGFPPALFNQAIMEFGAMQCKPVSPSCSSCSLMESCVAFRKKKVNELPV
jgi:A/G-specific adenine glycosylase